MVEITRENGTFAKSLYCKLTFSGVKWIRN